METFFKIVVIEKISKILMIKKRQKEDINIKSYGSILENRIKGVIY